MLPLVPGPAGIVHNTFGSACSGMFARSSLDVCSATLRTSPTREERIWNVRVSLYARTPVPLPPVRPPRREEHRRIGLGRPRYPCHLLAQPVQLPPVVPVGALGGHEQRGPALVDVAEERNSASSCSSVVLPLWIWPTQ